MSGRREILGRDPPHASAADRRLFERVRAETPDGDALTSERLADLDRRFGRDFATAWLCLQLRQSPGNREAVEHLESDGPLESVEPATLVLMPGAFYRRHHHTGADGRRLRELAESLGWRTERVEAENFGTLRRNADLLHNHLLHASAKRIVVASLSKGSTEVATALRDPRSAVSFRNVCGWINLSGLVHGTPLVDWLRARPLRRIGVHLLLWARGERFATLDELRRRHDGPLAAPLPLPPHLRAVHIAGFPLRSHLSHPWAQHAYERAWSWGPNDGGGILLADLLRLPGTVYPAWGADHYLRPDWNADSLIQRALCLAASFPQRVEHAATPPRQLET